MDTAKKYQLSSDNIWLRLAELREEKSLCDVELVAENETFPVHRVVLAAASPYFKAMFTGGFKEKEQDAITINGISSEGLRCVLDAIYSSQITLTEENVEDILPVADLFHLDEITKVCETFLQETNKSESNCINFLLLAQKYDLESVCKTCEEFILDNFEKVVETPDFVTLLKDLLCRFLCDDRLKLPGGEIEVFRAALKWIVDESNENVEPAEILKHVRYPRIPADLLVEEVMKNSMVYQCTELRESVLRALKFHGNIFTQPCQVGPQFKPRGEQKLLLIPDGTKDTNSYSTKEDTSPIHVLDPKTLFSKEDDTFQAPFAFAYRSMCAVTMNNYMFLFGTLSKSLNPVAMRFDGATMTWNNLQTPPYRATLASGVARQQDDIYLTGGMLVTPTTTTYDPSQVTSETWKYSIPENSWVAEQPLPKPLVHHAMISRGRFVYVTGGLSTEGSCSDLYTFDVPGKLWLTKAKMLSARHGHCLEVTDEKIYALGGRCSRVIQGIEVYSIAEDQWTELENANIPHCFLSQTFPLNDKLYIVGGCTRNGPCDSISCFDPKEKKVLSMTDLPFKIEGGVSALLTLPRK